MDAQLFDMLQEQQKEGLSDEKLDSILEHYLKKVESFKSHVQKIIDSRSQDDTKPKKRKSLKRKHSQVCSFYKALVKK